MSDVMSPSVSGAGEAESGWECVGHGTPGEGDSQEDGQGKDPVLIQFGLLLLCGLEQVIWPLWVSDACL